jgi:hypothetical protein
VTTKRPSLTHKSSRKEKERVDGALEMGVQFTIDGVEHRVVMGDLSALDIRALRSEVGITFPSLLAKLFSDDETDIDLIAAAVWLARRVNGGEPSLKYVEVASEMGYDVIQKIRDSSEQITDDVDEDKEPGSLNPEG